MYTKEMFKTEIVDVIKTHGYVPEIIGKKTFDIAMKNIRNVDKEFYDSLMDIATMENGPEYEMTKEEFMKFLEKM